MNVKVPEIRIFQARVPTEGRLKYGAQPAGAGAAEPSAICQFLLSLENSALQVYLDDVPVVSDHDVYLFLIRNQYDAVTDSL